MDSIIQHLRKRIQYLEKMVSFLLTLLCRYIPLRQMSYDDSQSPDYQKYKVDRMPVIKKFERYDYKFLQAYYEWRYGEPVKPIQRRKGKSIPENIVCPRCGAPHPYIYDNDGGKGAYRCKVCSQTFASGVNLTSPVTFVCPYCGRALQPKRERKHFTVHTCINKQCTYYLTNLNKLPKDLSAEKRHAYRLHYTYREFHFNFFDIDLSSLPENASSLKFTKNNAHIMGLCLSYHVNYALSLRKTAQIMREVHNIQISHTMIANYAHTAACIVKPFVDSYPYVRSDTFIGDETYIKVRSERAFVWLVMDAVSRSVIGYFVSANRAVGSCILAMRLAFGRLTKLPDNFKFIADGYSAYPLAAQQFEQRQENPLSFEITPVIGLTNNDAVSAQFRPYKQKIERLNRTYKASYRVSCGYDNLDGANYAVTLWVAYYNFLRTHMSCGDYGRYLTLNPIPELASAGNMPAKWQVLLRLGQETILNQQAS
jgi:transposase-like protein/DNA-directed RNA polymerase subunit RPC12/RpoP